jgi:hypothetical protein
MISFNNFTELKYWAEESNNRFTFIYACEPCLDVVENLKIYFPEKEFAKISINDFLSTSIENSDIQNNSGSFFRYPLAAPVPLEDLKKFIEECN